MAEAVRGQPNPGDEGMRPGLGQKSKGTNLRGLVIFYDATQCSFGRTQGTVQHVDVDLSSLVFRL